MRKIYLLMPVFLLSIHTGAQLNINNLVHLVDCQNYRCVSDLTQTKGFHFTDSTYDDDFKTSRYVFEHKSLQATSNTVTLEYDGIAGEAVVHFETIAEDFYRNLLNDITTSGFTLYHTYPSGDVVYSYPTTKMSITVNTDTYDDGLHYIFTFNYKADISANTSKE